MTHEKAKSKLGKDGRIGLDTIRRETCAGLLILASKSKNKETGKICSPWGKAAHCWGPFFLAADKDDALRNADKVFLDLILDRERGF